MGPERRQMLRQALLFSLVVFGVKVSFVIHQTDLGINNNIAAFWQVYHYIGVTALTRIIFECYLGVVLSAIGQTRIF